MALETVTHLSDLVATNPPSGDPLSQADDHIRNIKSALRTDLPNITGPVTATHGQINAAAAGPAFSAYQSTPQSIPSTTTLGKVQLQAEEFDTASAFDSTTNYRFTPLTAGYYQVNWSVGFGLSLASLTTSLFKNGGRFKDGNLASSATISGGSALVQMNGTTDYLEVFVAQSSGSSTNTSAVPYQTNFSASLIRGT